MPDPIRCPGCGASNEAGAVACAQCNFPLVEPGRDPASAAPAAPGAPASPAAGAPPVPAGTTGASAEFHFDPGPPPLRRARQRPDAMQPIQMQIWLFTGVAVILGIVYFAAQGFWHSNARPVEGAAPEQQQRADLARQTLERDSTNLAARIELANVLYDTGNWSEAIVHYQSALRQDPNRSTTMVDLGVCYYNLSQFAAAESLFRRAVEVDPHQSVAMFNLGIIAESQGRWDDAMREFHRALQAGPPDAMKAVLQQHIQEAMEKSGKTAPPLRN
jgi:tetratricopeptide (TPR) repeat protein